MTENPKLEVSRPEELTQGEAGVLRILNEVLTSEVDPATASANLARSLREHISSQASGSLGIASELLWDLWAILLEVVGTVSIDHPWHEVLIAAVDNLRQGGGAVAASGDNSLEWEDLPQLSMYLFDKWADPTDLEGHTPQDIEAWKRFNSFASRLLSHDFQPWIAFPYWEIAAGLETVPQDAAVFECKLWVATEWLIRCGSIIFQDITSNEELSARSLASIRPGPLCGDISPHSIQRWELWQSRLVELAEKISSKEATADGFPLPESCLSRLEKASMAMHIARYRFEAKGQASRDADSSATVAN